MSDTSTRDGVSVTAETFVSPYDNASCVQIDTAGAEHARIFLNDCIAYDARIGVPRHPAFAAMMAALWNHDHDTHLAIINRATGSVSVSTSYAGDLWSFEGTPFDPFEEVGDGALRDTMLALAALLPDTSDADTLYISADGVSIDGFPVR